MRVILALVLVPLVAACSTPGPGEAPDGIYDPNEAANRQVHAFNRRVDERFLRGAGSGYADTVPQDVQLVVTNFADTVSLPRTIVNQILQGRPGPATANTLRFALNATVGLGGLLDPASDIGLERDESDFGETLHVWGVPEGAYVELPLLGPSTERDAVGEFVDLFLDPLDYVLSKPAQRVATAAWVAAQVGERGQFGDTVDSVLYESADSYAQLRLIYLQNRRFELGDETPTGAEDDPLALDTEGF